MSLKHWPILMLAIGAGAALIAAGAEPSPGQFSVAAYAAEGARIAL